MVQPVILAEQILLMVRTAILGDMSIEKVTAELIAQHSRSYKGYFGKSGSKGGGKDRRPWNRSYYVEEGEAWDESWDSTSQSLGGFEDYEDAAFYGGADDHYEAEDDPVLEAYAAMVEQGLDEEDGEAMEWAADVLQAESEAYFARQGAKGGGHKGFMPRRDFSVHGALTFEERKSKVQEMKQKTTCRRCGQKGHWANDPQCPKSGKKSGGKGFGGSSSTSTTSTAAKSFGGKQHGGGKSSGKKPRTVYFTINEYEENTGPRRAYMMTGNFNAVPPPTSLGGSNGADGAAVPIYVMNSDEEMEPDDKLDQLIAQAALRQDGGPQALREGVVEFQTKDDGTAVKEAVVAAAIEDEKRTEGLMKFEETEKRVRSQQRIEYLDNFLSRTPVDHPEFRDAYNERWNEFFPGHPLFTDQDKRNLARWEQKALMGLPKMPEGGQVQEASGVGSAHGGCRHERTTRHGSNAYVKVLRCKDCGVELERTKVEKPEKMQTSSPSTCQHLSKDRRGTTASTWQWKCKDCGHVEKGHRGEGDESSSGSSGGQALKANEAMRVIGLMQTALEIQKEVGNHISLKQLDMIYEKCKNHVAKENANESSGVRSSTSTTSGGVDYVERARKAGGEVMKEEEAKLLHRKKVGTGVHQGKTYREVYEKEETYCKGLRTKLCSGSLKHASLLEFARYAEARSYMKDEKVAYVLMEDEEDREEERLDDIANTCPMELVAVLDTGCNNTCHGDRWMQKFKEFCDVEPALEESEGRFKGVGGRVEVAGKRNLRIKMRSLDKEYLPGKHHIGGTMSDSDAPLLLEHESSEGIGLGVGHGGAHSLQQDFGQGTGAGGPQWIAWTSSLSHFEVPCWACYELDCMSQPMRRLRMKKREDESRERRRGFG